MLLPEEGLMDTLPALRGNNKTQDAARVQHKFRDFFISDVGRIPWQSAAGNVNLQDCHYEMMCKQ